ncbi:DinB family protein [Sporosarcina oncorhynchi]|uniref:DinB family protein n=1 Tax=Sporosarcina oncorhynchi TaxID=3056444 RepID=A0ABZ0L4N6_9BACL|nr:DinB family protein [Sporosarcina sp. T2O-4]WOV87167.1 DinB family protein [Sporosarcina sp. T2O-4]
MVFEGNNKIRRKIYLAIDGLTDDEFNKVPSTGGWSPKQILEHLTLMETYIALKVSKELKNPTSRKAAKRYLILPDSPMVKGGMPKETLPSDTYKTISELKVELHNSRIYLLDVYDASCKDTLKQKSFEHPNLGLIPLYQWFPFVGQYEKCHLKRLKKTIEELLINDDTPQQSRVVR